MMLFADMLFVRMLFMSMRYDAIFRKDTAISESHKCIDLSPVDGSPVVFFSRAIATFFPPSYTCFLAS